VGQTTEEKGVKKNNVHKWKRKKLRHRRTATTVRGRRGGKSQRVKEDTSEEEFGQESGFNSVRTGREGEKEGETGPKKETRKGAREKKFRGRPAESKGSKRRSRGPETDRLGVETKEREGEKNEEL